MEACEELLVVLSNLLLSLVAWTWFSTLCSGNSHATLTDLDLIAVVECSTSSKRALEVDIDLVRGGVTTAGQKGKRLSTEKADDNCRCGRNGLGGIVDVDGPIVGGDRGVP
jgi:hypothetical protein